MSQQMFDHRFGSVPYAIGPFKGPGPSKAFEQCFQTIVTDILGLQWHDKSIT